VLLLGAADDIDGMVGGKHHAEVLGIVAFLHFHGQPSGLAVAVKQGLQGGHGLSPELAA